ncbi:MAG: glutamate mutase L [Chloroflexi bacterium]|nr:glutamate mutase L [Chloroflexota bacterium]
MKTALLVDFGSTYTKLTAVDVAKPEILAQAQSPTTVDSDIMIGLARAFELLTVRLGSGNGWRADTVMACSSAAGGLKMVAIGLVPELTAEAAKLAALGAGAKVLRTYAYELSHQELEQLLGLSPDIILLAGGTDGGNKDVLLHNAKMLAGSPLHAPVVLAGNKAASEDAKAILAGAGKTVRLTENVMPELGRLNVEPARATIRDVFMRRIVHAKGLDKAEKMVGSVLMPTPMAVLAAARLIAQGTESEPGLGDLLIVDVGGATTDAHSIGEGQPSQPGVVLKGLPPPYAQRTVEGDLGIRYNAMSILEMAGERRIAQYLCAVDGDPSLRSGLEAEIRCLCADVTRVPGNEWQSALDIALARVAVEIAVERHAGRIEAVHLPFGTMYTQYGKDLTNVTTVIGTGGIFAYNPQSRRVLEGALFNEAEPQSLRPKQPELYVDTNYILYAIGLLAEAAPTEAVRLAKRHLSVACPVGR